MFKNEEDIQTDKIDLENSRAQVPGSSGASFTPDGNRVAIGTRDVIWVANLSTWKVETHLGHEEASRFGGKNSLQFIDNHRLVIGAEGAIFLWDLKEGLVTDQLKLASMIISPRAIAWSETTRMLAFSIGTTMEPVKVVRVSEDGFGAVRDVPGFEGVPRDLVFSRDGLYLAATGDEQGVFVREVETGELVGELPTKGLAENLERFGENKLLVSGVDVALWTFLQEEELLEYENADLQPQVTGQVVARVAGTIALGTLTAIAVIASSFTGSGGDGIWAAGEATYKYASTPVESSQRPWCGRSTAVSPDGKWLVDIYPGITSEVIRVFDLELAQVAKTLKPRGEYSCIVLFSPDSSQLLITTDKVARFYDTHTWQHRDIRSILLN
jgi:WD40 repeat protein